MRKLQPGTGAQSGSTNLNKEPPQLKVESFPPLVKMFRIQLLLIAERLQAERNTTYDNHTMLIRLLIRLWAAILLVF